MNRKQAEYLFTEILKPLPGKCDSGDAVNAALCRLASANRGDTLFFSKGEYLIKSTVSVPENVDLYFEKGASLTVAENGCFNFDGCVITVEGNGRIFNPADKLTGFSHISFGRPEWFGAKADGRTDCAEAFTAAFSLFGNVLLSEGTYRVKTPVTLFPESSGPLTVEGAGIGKTVLLVSPGITAFNKPCLEKDRRENALVLKNLTMTEDGKKSESVAVSLNGSSYADISHCAFYGFRCAFETSYSGWIHYHHCISGGNRIVCEIGEHSMFLYYKFCTSVGDGCFLRCDVPPSGGYSNGIDINGCLIDGALDYGIFTKENQAVFIDDCHISNCRGKAGIHCGRDFDTSVSNCEITGDASNPGFIGIESVSSHSQYYSNNYISGCETGIYIEGPYDWRAMTAIERNLIAGCTGHYYSLKCVNDCKIYNNLHDGSLSEKDAVIEDNTVNFDYENNSVTASKGYSVGGLHPHLVATETDAFTVSDEQEKRVAPFGDDLLYNFASFEPDSFETADTENFPEAISAHPAKPKVLRLRKGIYRVEKDITVDENIILVLERGAIFSIPYGVTLTFDCAVIKAGPWRIFEGEGRVGYMKNVGFAYADWFGETDKAAADAVSLAVASCKNVFLPRGKVKLDKTVKFTPGRLSSVRGIAAKQTEITPDDKSLLFSSEGSGGVLFADLVVIGKNACEGSDFFAFAGEKGSLVSLRCTFMNMNDIYRLSGCDSIYAYLTRNISIERFFDFDNCRNVLLDSLLDPPGCGYFVTAKDSENLVLYNIASVSGHSVDVKMKNCRQIIIKQGGLDASCYRTPAEYKTSYAAADMVDCSDILIEGHWVATNIAPPGTVNARYESPKRDNLRFTRCDRVKVAGNSLVNSHIGLLAVNCSNMVITGNKGEASMLHDYSVKFCENVTFCGNFCLSMAWRGTKREIYINALKNSRVRMNSIGNKKYALRAGLPADGNVVSDNRFSVLAGNPAEMAAETARQLAESTK